MPGDAPALPEITDIKVLDTLKIMCEVMEDPHKSRAFDSQAMQASDGPNCKAKKSNRSWQTMKM